MSRMLKFCLRIRYSSRSSGPSKASRKTSSASGGMYRSCGRSNSGSPYRRATAMLSTTSSTTSSPTSASTSIGDPELRSALLGLVDVRLLADARVLVLGLGLSVDTAVPPDRPALQLLVLEGRLLRL